MTFSAKLTLLLALLFCLLPGVAGAQGNGSFPSAPVDEKILRVQAQAEEVYERTEYKRAFFIYRNELAPIGDKYAQYMIGFMYLTGKGVEEDRAAGSAWHRLAAERGTKEFVRRRDALMDMLDAEEKARSDQLFLEIRKQYSDLVLILKALRRDQDSLGVSTGSRLGASSATPMTIISARGGGRTSAGADYYGQIKRRMQARLDYVKRITQVEISGSNMATVDLDEVEQAVNEYLNRID